MPKRTTSSSSSSSAAAAAKTASPPSVDAAEQSSKLNKRTNKKKNNEETDDDIDLEKAQEEVNRLRELLSEAEARVATAMAKPLQTELLQRWEEVWAKGLRVDHWSGVPIDEIKPKVRLVLSRIFSHATRPPVVYAVEEHSKHAESYNLHILCCELREDDGSCFRVVACRSCKGWYGPPILIKNPKQDGGGTGFSESHIKRFELPDAKHPAPPISQEEFENLSPGLPEDIDETLKFPAWKLLLAFMSWSEDELKNLERP